MTAASFGSPRLEQLRHPRQTAGDVAGLGAFGRDTRDHVARLHLAAEIDRQNGVDRQQVAGIAATRELLDLAVLALDDHRGLEVGRPRSTVRQSVTTRLAMPVDSSTDSDIDWPSTRSSKATVPSASVRIGRVYGIPFGDTLAALDVLAVLDAQPRAVLDAVDGPLGAVGIGHGDHDAAAHGNPVAVGVLDDGVLALGLDHDLAVEVRLDERLLGDLSSAADVERAHGELGARLADRLRRDHADRLAHVDRRAAGEIAPVAGAADAVGQSRR